MKPTFFLIFFVFVSLSLFCQTIDQVTDVERCPSFDYPNGAGEFHTITFPDAANQYTIGTTTNCNIKFYNNNVQGNSNIATCVILYKDQSASA